MKHKFAVACLFTGSLFGIMATAYAEDLDRPHPINFVKDSAITSSITAKFAIEHPSNLRNITVDTDDHGVVWLGGTTRTQFDVDKAVSVAQKTDGVHAVKNQITVKSEP